MKKIIIPLFLTLTSCQKEVSYEKSCGIITDVRHSQGNIVLIIDNGAEVTITLYGVSQYNIGDKYCK